MYRLVWIIIGSFLISGCTPPPKNPTKQKAANYLKTFTPLAKINEKFAALAKAPPEGSDKVKMMVTHSFLTPKTVCGNPIPMISLTSSLNPTRFLPKELDTDESIPVPKKELLFISGLHMNEPTPPEAMLKFVDSVVAEFKTNAKFREDLRWIVIHIVPIVNVDTKLVIDGVATTVANKTDPLTDEELLLARFGIDMYRKNQKFNKRCQTLAELLRKNGVDLNRNFEADWDALNKDKDNEEDVKIPKRFKYRGPSKASEKEVQAIQGFIKQRKPNLVFFLDLHDLQGPEISMPTQTIRNKALYGILEKHKFWDNANGNPQRKIVNTTKNPVYGTAEHFANGQAIRYVVGIEIGKTAVPTNNAYIVNNSNELKATFLKLSQQIATEHKDGKL